MKKFPIVFFLMMSATLFFPTGCKEVMDSTLSGKKKCGKGKVLCHKPSGKKVCRKSCSDSDNPQSSCKKGKVPCINSKGKVKCLKTCPSGTSSGDDDIDISGDIPKNKPLKVFILAGQSNMEGKGRVEPKGDKKLGTLRHLAEKNGYMHFLSNNTDKNGKKMWAAFGDAYVIDPSRQSVLKADFKASEGIGPELGFGVKMAKYYKGKYRVLMIKTAWGGQSLAVNFRPPSAPEISSDKDVGGRWREMLDMIDRETKKLKAENYNYELVGMLFHQGWNDRVNPEYVAQYQDNLVDFINDIRDYIKKKEGLSDMPFVLANTGQGGYELNEKAEKLALDQLGILDRTPERQAYRKKDPKDPYVSRNNVLKSGKNLGVVDTRLFWKESKDSPTSVTSHWNHNAESYLMIGTAMADEMIAILGKN